MRTQKTVNGVVHNYYYSGDLLLAEEWNNHLMVFLYDANGSPVGIKYRKTDDATGTWSSYWYDKNLQGDVVAIYDDSGTPLVSYTYDAWGNHVVTPYNNGLSIVPIANNPIRYRGYYYDVDLGLYYLQTRYYDSNIGRFISPDHPAVITATPASLTDKNLYAYCDNNPVMRVDGGGQFWDTFFDIFSLGFSVVEVCVNPADVWAWVGLAGDLIDLIPFVSGVGETTKALKVTSKVVDNIDDVIDTTKSIYRTADVASDIRRATGTYEIIYESGKNYVGKGGIQRAIASARRYSENSNKVIVDRVFAIRWISANDSRSAFINEYLLQIKNGVNNKYTYNKIWSPGRKHIK